MPCVVPTCGASVGTFKLFPKHKSLAERWLDAIQAGCGVKAADDDVLGPVLDDDHMKQKEICHWHFAEPDSEVYQEPKIFLNCEAEKVEIDSCRLCLRIYPASDMVSIDGLLSGVDIKVIVFESLGVEFKTTDLLEQICVHCLVRLDLLTSIKKKFIDTETNFQNLISISRDYRKKNRRLTEISPKVEVIVQTEQDSNTESDLEMDEEYISDEWTPQESLHDTVINESSAGSKQESMSTVGENSKELSLKQIIARKCYICPVILESANDLSSHLTEKHASMKDKRCVECSLEFPMLSGYNKHLSRHDESERPHKCSACPMRFKIKRAKMLHENTHHGKNHDIVLFKEKTKSVICETCGESFQYLSMLTRHVRLKHNASQERPMCKICGKLFTRHGSLVRHMQIHTNEKPYSCDKCDASFRRLLLLKHHVQKVHEGKNPHVCVECKLEFKSYESLYNHKRFIHLRKLNIGDINPTKLQYAQICKVCNEMFSRTSDLQQHISISHADVSYPYFECPKCPRKFVSKQSLYCHKPMHTDRCVCTECGKQYGTAQALRNHIASFHEKRQYDCPICPTKTYTSESALRTHMIIHTKGKQFACDFCDKCFHRKDQLTIHRRVHTGEKPFECPKCSKRFGDDGTFHKHKKRCLAPVSKKESIDAPC